MENDDIDLEDGDSEDYDSEDDDSEDDDSEDDVSEDDVSEDDVSEDDFYNALEKLFGFIEKRIIAFQNYIRQQKANDGTNISAEDIDKALTEYNKCLVLETNAKDEVGHLVKINNSNKSHVSTEEFEKALGIERKWKERMIGAYENTDYHDDFWIKGDDYEYLELKQIFDIVCAEIERLGNSKASIEEVKRFHLSVSSKIRDISILKVPVTFREAMRQKFMKDDIIELIQMQDLAIPGISCKELYDLCTQLSEDFN